MQNRYLYNSLPFRFAQAVPSSIAQKREALYVVFMEYFHATSLESSPCITVRMTLGPSSIHSVLVRYHAIRTLIQICDSCQLVTDKTAQARIGDPCASRTRSLTCAYTRRVAACSPPSFALALVHYRFFEVYFSVTEHQLILASPTWNYYLSAAILNADRLKTSVGCALFLPCVLYEGRAHSLAILHRPSWGGISTSD